MSALLARDGVMTSDAVFHYAREPLVTRIHCPVCDAPGERAFPLSDRYGFPIRVARCPLCRLVYLADVMTRAGYDRLYAGDPSPYRRLVWSQPHYDQAAARARLRIDQQRYGTDLRDWLVLTGRVFGQVLDAGGSTGRISTIVAPAAHRVVVDPARDEIALCQDGAETLTGHLEDGLPDRFTHAFDLILLCETLDHLIDPVAALRTLDDALAPGGLIYLDYVPQAPLKIDHPLYFNEASCLSLLSRLGWHVAARRNPQSWAHRGFLCVRV